MYRFPFLFLNMTNNTDRCPTLTRDTCISDDMEDFSALHLMFPGLFQFILLGFITTAPSLSANLRDLSWELFHRYAAIIASSAQRFLPKVQSPILNVHSKMHYIRMFSVTEFDSDFLSRDTCRITTPYFEVTNNWVVRLIKYIIIYLNLFQTYRHL